MDAIGMYGTLTDAGSDSRLMKHGILNRVVEDVSQMIDWIFR